MAIPAIASFLSPVASIKGLASVIRAVSNTESEVATPPANPNKLMESLLQSLSQLPTSPSAPNTQNTSEPMQNFVQSLMNALESQNTPAKLTFSLNPSVSQAFLGNNPLAQGLESLIEQINPSKTAGSQALKELEQNANQLFNALGVASGGGTLNQFLDKFKQSLATNGSVGNILSTKA